MTDIKRGVYVALAALVATAMLSGCGGSSGEPEGTANDSLVATKPSETVAFRWNELLLSAIRNDLARPPVHARNLFHVSAAMYDAWASGNPPATPYLLGQQRNGVDCATDDASPSAQFDAQQAISFAAYRLIIHRYARSPGRLATRERADALMQSLGYDHANTSTDLSGNESAALGNQIAECYIAYGLADGANEAANYANRSYAPINPPLAPAQPGNPGIIDIDRWQSIALPRSIDQSGNPIIGVPAFIGAEWGQVEPFALTPDDRQVRQRDGVDYPVYFDPGPPPRVADDRFGDYRWHFSLVARWGAHLDPDDEVMIDISPGAIGNIGGGYLSAPVDPRSFYQDTGGDPGTGRALNPVTAAPYSSQRVARGDYTRVLAEYWADGPESETPPGHWFVILNDIADQLTLNQPGSGDASAQPLEWLIKAYFTLGGAMHDSAIAAWGLKGWYDYVRPISAIRAMADAGQSSNPALPSYAALGLALEPGAVELVAAGDQLAGADGEHVNKLKLYTWRGPDLNADGTAGVGWILAERWWPYQRPTFVTPPFAGFVSGHSSYSSAAATVLEKLTGDAYFPGGVYEVPIEANSFLAFETGPSRALTLQWATYRDAADQCSLSRIWGGIHPPADDLPGRRIGVQVGERGFDAAARLFGGGQIQ